MIIDLGSKKVEITQWKAKTKKNFLNAIKNKGENFTNDDIMDVLLYPYITPNDIFLNDDEIQYLLVQIRKISINEDISFITECKKCNKDIKITCDVSDIINFKKNQFPIDKNNIKWKDLKYKNSLKNIFDKYDDFPKILEILAHIEKINNKTITSFEEILEIYEDMDLTESENLEKTFNEIDTVFNIKKSLKCPHCNTLDEYYFEEIPGFFDPILPREIKI